MKWFRVETLLEQKSAEVDVTRFVPVADWSEDLLWVWFRVDSGEPPTLIALAHEEVKQTAKYIARPKGVVAYRAQMDPYAYKGPSDLYPSKWEAGEPKPKGEPPKTLVKGSYQVPEVSSVADVVGPTAPEGLTLAGPDITDENGYPVVVDVDTGHVFSLLPNGSVMQWEEDEGVYYHASKEDGEWGVDHDQPSKTPQEVAQIPALVVDPDETGEDDDEDVPDDIAQAIAFPLKDFTILDDFKILDFHPEYVLLQAPSGEKVKWFKGTKKFVYADDPSKEFDVQAAAQPSVGAAVSAAPVFKEKTVFSDEPEAPPVNIVYTGKVDPNGLPLVDEVPESDDSWLTGLTLLPDHRVGLWKSSLKAYKLYAFTLSDGYIPVSPPKMLSVDKAKALMTQLSLGVKAGKYYSTKKAGVEPEVPTVFTAPLPPNMKKIDQTDVNGLPMGKSLPSDPDDDSELLSILPNGTAAKWMPSLKKYQVWVWASVLGDYNYYPRHPAKYYTLKEAQKRLQQTAPHQAPDISEPSEKLTPVLFTSNEDTDHLVSTTKKDPLGLPLFALDGDLKLQPVLTFFPNGEIVILEKDKSYSVVKYSNASKVFVYAQPKKVYTKEQAQVLINKYDWDPSQLPSVPSSPEASGYKELTPTGHEDANGYPMGEFNGYDYSMLPGNKVGVWSGASGHYILYDYDEDAEDYFNTGKSWDPPGAIKSEAPVNIAGKMFARLTDSNGTTVFVLPDGKYGVRDGEAIHYYYFDTQEQIFKPAGKGAGTDLSSLLDFYTTKQSGLHTLTPNGTVDQNGLPEYIVKIVGHENFDEISSLLPNGTYASYFPETSEYLQLVYDLDENIWKFAIPEIVYTLDDINSLHVAQKVQYEIDADDEDQPSASTMNTPVSSEPLHPSLELTGEHDVNGFPLARVKMGFIPQGSEYTWLPTGELAKWSGALETYKVLEFDDDIGEWSYFSHPIKLIDLEDLHSSGLMPSAPAVAPKAGVTIDQADTTTEPQTFLDLLADPSAVGLPPPHPPLDKMTEVSVPLKGAGQKVVLEDPETGNRYLFKFALPKSGADHPEPFRVASQVGFSTMAADVRPDAYIPVSSAEYKGKIGTIQPMLELDEQSDLEGVPPTVLTDQQKLDVASEHLLDWLMGQHDSFGANFVIKDGRVLGIDKEQGWKYLHHASYPEELSVHYKPNTKLFGEQEPYYNKFWKAFADGSMDFDPKLMSQALKRLEDVPAKKLEAVVRNYVDTQAAMQGPENAYKREAFVKEILSRRATQRRDFENFITDLYKQRTGESGRFTFKEGWKKDSAEAVQWQTINTTPRERILSVLGSNALKAHNAYPNDLMLVRVSTHTAVSEVQQLLDSMGIEPATEDPTGQALSMNPIYGSMYNSVIVNAADLDKPLTLMVEVSQDEFAPHSGLPEYYPTVMMLPEASADISTLKKIDNEDLGPLGKTITLDADAVEQQTANVQRVITPEGSEIYIVHFKLRKKYWKALMDKGTAGSYEWPLGAYDPSKDALVADSWGYSQPARVITSGANSTIYVMGDSAAWSFKGSVYAKLRKTGSATIHSLLGEALAALDLKARVLKKPTKQDKKKYNYMQALWALSPYEHDTLSEAEKTVPKLRQKLQGVLTDDQIKAITQVQGSEGRGSPILPGLWKTLGGGVPGEPVVRYLFWNVDTASVPKILKSAAMGIHERLRAGLGAGVGTSPTSDISSGGADGITMRIATKGSADKSLSGVGNILRSTRLIIAPEILDRLDVHIASGDSFGSTNPDGGNGYYFTHRKSLSDAVRYFDQQANHMGNTEVVLRRSVPPQMIKRIVTKKEKVRKRVIKYCKDAGITEYLGCPIEDFVVVEDDQGAVYEKYLKPLGY